MNIHLKLYPSATSMSSCKNVLFTLYRINSGFQFIIKFLLNSEEDLNCNCQILKKTFFTVLKEI